MLSWGGGKPPPQTAPPSQNNRFRRENQSRRAAAHYPQCHTYLLTYNSTGTRVPDKLPWYPGNELPDNGRPSPGDLDIILIEWNGICIMITQSNQRKLQRKYTRFNTRRM